MRNELKKCKSCVHYIRGNINSKSHGWCCKFSNKVDKIIGHCKINNGFKSKIGYNVFEELARYYSEQTKD